MGDEDGVERSRYRVILVDPQPDLGVMSEDELSIKYRSWMIGLSNQGLTAMKNVPGLYEDYVSKIGVDPQYISIRFGKRTFSQKPDKDMQGYIVDRNFVVAAMARFIHDKYSKSNMYVSHYDSRVIFVDGENKNVHVRTKERDIQVPYDLLIGCDGIRSVVRGAFVQAQRDFELSLSDIFFRFKAVHVSRHESLPVDGFHFLPGAVPNMMGISLPESGDKMNISLGYVLSNTCDAELFSDDVEVVAEYLKRRFQCFPLKDYHDFAQQWVSQSWNSTGQVHCNYYHSNRLNAIIMGDAAHATSPAIGMGMNTALGDAHVFYDLLLKHEHDLKMVLPAFSEERVKEGNALTDLSFYLTSLDTKTTIRIQLEDVLREYLFKILPSGWIYRSPQAMVGTGMKLSVVYDYAKKMGRFDKTRNMNDRIRREYFEEMTGMTKSKTSNLLKYLLTSTVLAVSLGYYMSFK